MIIEKIKTEVDFSKIRELDIFEYENKIYMKLPTLRCIVKAYAGPYKTVDNHHEYNAVEIKAPDSDGFYPFGWHTEYAEFKDNTKVKPLKAELKIHE